MEEWIPIVMFLVIGTVLCTLLYLRYRARQEIQRTVRTLVEHGKDLSPELLAGLTAESVHGHADLRRGVLWLALAGAVGLIAWGLEERDALALAGLPLMLGIAYLGLWRFSAARNA